MRLSDLLAPAGCAVAVIDMQNDFCHPEGAVARMGQDVSAAAALVVPITSLLTRARSAGVPVIFISVTDGPWSDTPGWDRRGAYGEQLPVESIPLVREGTWGAGLFELTPQPGDLVLTKHRYSAFVGTSLELALASRRVRTLLLAGTQTDVCVQYTAADAVSRGITPVAVRECVATRSDEDQSSALRNFAGHLGPVLDLDEVDWRT